MCCDCRQAVYVEQMIHNETEQKRYSGLMIVLKRACNLKKHHNCAGSGHSNEIMIISVGFAGSQKTSMIIVAILPILLNEKYFFLREELFVVNLWQFQCRQIKYKLQKYRLLKGCGCRLPLLLRWYKYHQQVIQKREYFEREVYHNVN